MSDSATSIPTRELAAIMFSDVVGYTAIMGRDERSAIRALDEHRELLRGLLPKFNGRILGEIGDGTLTSFHSAVDAVNCAREVQATLKDDAELRLRIGIHVGDVLFANNTVLGDGVNVASRIHALAPPGGICISERVYDEIRNQPGLPVKDLGEQTLKNVSRPIRIYTRWICPRILVRITKNLTLIRRTDSNSRRERHEKLASAAATLRALVKPDRLLHIDTLNLAKSSRDRLHADYEYSNIYAIPYDLSLLPSDEILIADYRYMLGVYRQLVDHPLRPSMQQLLETQIPTPPAALPPKVKQFVPRPPKAKGKGSKGKGLRISTESKKVGDQGEKIVYKYELDKVKALGMLTSEVLWHSREGETPGWDISSLDESGKLMRIEVKASVGSTVSSLIMTANEWRAAREHGTGYYVYIVTDALKPQSSIEIIRDPATRIGEGTMRVELASVLVALVPDGKHASSSSENSLIGAQLQFFKKKKSQN